MKYLELIPEFVEVVPDDMKQGVLYVSEKYRTAIHLCACGCGLQTVTPTNEYGWNIEIKEKKVTLAPSISNWQYPCKSHYFVRENRVEWC